MYNLFVQSENDSADILTLRLIGIFTFLEESEL